MNICFPDNGRSCAACCGLYNVSDGSRQALERNLSRRTEIFQVTERSPDALENFKNVTRKFEAVLPLDGVIHVCEFAGFLNADRTAVGCMLHPSSPGNAQVDLRGMCHYGSMACKTFYCPAWEELPQSLVPILVSAIDDWHLYGLVMTDVDFVSSIFSFVHAAGGPTSRSAALSGKAESLLKEILWWKSEWPHARDSTVRRSRYYIKGKPPTVDPDENAQRILGCLNFTFGSTVDSPAARAEIRGKLDRLAEACATSTF